MKDTSDISKGWFLMYLKRYHRPFAVATIMTVLALGCASALLFTSGHLISRSALRPDNILMVYVPIVLVRTFGFSKAVIQYLERLVGHNVVLRVLSSMRIRLYRMIEPQALTFRSRFRTGDMLGLLAEDIEQLQNIYLKVVLPVLSALLLYSIGIAMLGIFDGTFALLMALYCGFLFFILPAASLWASLAKRRQYKQLRNETYQELTDAIFGMNDWVLSGRTQSFLVSFQQKMNMNERIRILLRHKEWRTHWITQCAIGGAIGMITLWAGELASVNRIEIIWIAAISLLAFPILEAFLQAGDAVVRIPEYQESFRRLQHVGAPIQNGDLSPITQNDTTVVESALDSVDIRLEHVGFQYSESSIWSLRDVSLYVPQGGKVALLGRSGAGKSTLLHLIQGELQPTEGDITCNGQSFHANLPSERIFSVLNQHPYLFDTTVSNNIRLARPGANDEQVRSVMKQVGLHQLIEGLPEGYHTRVQEAGMRFSGGERQRMALARILLQDCPIVLLDEPTVGLDPVTEKELMNTVFSVLQGKTLIWITHHLNGVEQMDEVIFLEDGAISMRGTHAVLYRENARYRKLYDLDHPN